MSVKPATLRGMTNTTETPRVRMARQALESHRQKLATAFDKDQVRRQIAAAEKRLREEQEAADGRSH